MFDNEPISPLHLTVTTMPPNKRQEHKDLLRVLQRARPSVRKAILKEADKALVYSICELCDNTLSGNVPLTPTQKQKLKKHKTVLKKLAKRGESWIKKKKALTQKGGAFLPLLLSVLAPAIGNLIFGP